jgi:signal transduction histidine kinase
MTEYVKPMTVKWKITALTAILFAVLAITAVFVAEHVLMPSFADLETREADISMKRAQYGFDLALDQLSLAAGSWGNWTDAYRFALDRNHTFAAEQVTFAGLKQLNISALLFVDLSGHVLASQAMDLVSGRGLDLDLTSQQDLAANFPWRSELREGRPAHGLLRTNHGVLMIAGAPVLDGFGHGPSRGMVILGRLLSTDEVQRIGARAQANLSVEPVRPGEISARSVRRENVIEVYRTVDDLYGQPIVTMRVDVPRDITRRGFSAVYYASGYLIIAAVLVVVMLVLTLNRVVLKPLAIITRHAIAIGEGSDLSSRLNFEGNDEITVLARELDRMVGSMAESRGQLREQSYQAGRAQVATDVLHNVGNILNSVNISASMVADRVKHSKIAGVNRLGQLLLEQGGELPQFMAHDERGRRVPQYLAALSEQLQSDQRTTLEELGTLRENLDHIKNIVAMQQQYAKRCGVIEVVEATELVEDSLRLNAGALERHGVRLERQFNAVPAVSVDRHKVLQILVNLIRNAKYACDDSGRSDKLITLRIEAVDGMTRISVIDNGVGISAENMQRLFTHGFTTRASGHGFGLHSAALAAQELGGALRVASEGPGCGATFVLELPLGAAEEAREPELRRA